MKKLAILLSLLVTLPAFAGKVLTYTAVSQQSQEEANNLAMAGIAKQIVSQVNVNQKLSRQEKTAKGKSELSENYLSQSQVNSLVQIKGATITPIKVPQGYKATATLDLDEYTADIQFKMQTLKKELSDLEKAIDESIGKRLYAEALKKLERAKTVVKSYDEQANRLGQVYPIDESYQLEHKLPHLETKLQEELSQIRIEGPTEAFTLNSPEMPPWKVTVLDRQGPVGNFPLVAKQKYHVLLERRTQADGSATFKLRNVNFDNGPYEITVEPNLSLPGTELHNAFVLNYEVNQSKCSIRLRCTDVANVCSALEKRLAQKSVFVDDDPKLPLLEFKTAANEGKPLKINSNTTRFAYSIDYMLKGQGISFIAAVKGNGKNPTDATVQAMEKIDFAPLLKQLQPHCNH